MKLSDLVQAHAELKDGIRELNNGLVQPRDDIVAAILLATHQQHLQAGMLYDGLLKITAELSDITGILESS